MKAEQSTLMQKRKDEECEVKERILVSDIFFLIGSKDLCCCECHMNVLLCCFEFHMIVLKDEEREAKERMLVSDIIIFCLDQKIFIALSAT